MLRVSSSGATDNPITFGAYGQGERPVLCGANVIVGWARESGQANVWSVVVDAATPPREPDDGSVFDGSGTVHIWFDGQLGQQAASRQALSAQANWYYDGYRLYVYATDDPARLYTNPGIELPVRLEGIRLDDRPYTQRDRKQVAIQDLRLCRFRRWAVDAINTNSVTIRRCTVEWVGPGNVSGGYTNDPVAIGLNHNTANALVETACCMTAAAGCTSARPSRGTRPGATACGSARSTTSAAASTPRCTPPAGYSRATPSTTWRRRASAAWATSRPATSSSATSWRCGEQGIELRDNNTVAYNVVASCTTAAIIVIGPTGQTEDNINGGDYNGIFNNVLADVPEHEAIGFINGSGTTACVGNVIRNNIFAGVFLPIRFSAGIPAGGDSNVFDYNCYWNANPNAPYARQPGQMPLDQWRTQMGWDVHSIFADPRFVSAQPTAARDFALQAGSPCIDAGCRRGAAGGLSCAQCRMARRRILGLSRPGIQARWRAGTSSTTTAPGTATTPPPTPRP